MNTQVHNESQPIAIQWNSIQWPSLQPIAIVEFHPLVNSCALVAYSLPASVSPVVAQLWFVMHSISTYIQPEGVVTTWMMQVQIIILLHL